MRITYIAAGAAGSYCGACKHDVSLVLGLRAQGHDVELLPLYTPLRTDEVDPSVGRVFYGGINAYLQQRFALFRKAPASVDWLLNRPALLKAASRVAISTRPEALGDMTVSVLRGAQGYQRKELEKLVRFLEDGVLPEVVHLTNSLLSGLAPTIKSRLGVPVLCSLQGEESFIDRLPQLYRDQAMALLRENATSIDLFVAPSDAYAKEMTGVLGVPAEGIRVLRPGIDAEPYARTGPRVREPFRIAFLSRLAREKGLDLLCDAFRVLERERPVRPTANMLAIAGQALGGNRVFWKEVRGGLEDDGLWDRVEYAGELDFEGKLRFLRGASVFCQPSRFPERRGLACIEALAAGLPVVVPDSGVFRELLALTGGGALVPPDDAEALTEALRSLRDDPDRADRMGRAGAEGVREHFSLEGMVSRALQIYGEVLAGGRTANSSR